MIKLIFLDMDGVIATNKTVKDGKWAITKSCQNLLGEILKETGAKIVITSVWRLHTLEETLEFFKRKGFAFCEEIIGVTVRANHYVDYSFGMGIPRGVEIMHWLKKNLIWKESSKKELNVHYKYVILDDDSDMLLEQADHFVKCNWETGLTDIEKNKAIQILNN